MGCFGKPVHLANRLKQEVHMDCSVFGENYVCMEVDGLGLEGLRSVTSFCGNGQESHSRELPLNQHTSKFGSKESSCEFCDYADDVADDIKLHTSIASSSAFETSTVKPTVDEDLSVSDEYSVFSRSSDVNSLVPFIISSLQKSNDVLIDKDLSNASNSMRGAESSASTSRRGFFTSSIHSRFSDITNMSSELSNTSHYSGFFINTDVSSIDSSDSSWIVQLCSEFKHRQ